jgi:hypothetical protein
VRAGAYAPFERGSYLLMQGTIEMLRDFIASNGQMPLPPALQFAVKAAIEYAKEKQT